MTSFGASLRREREVRGVSLQEIASATKIGVTMLKAIEDDRFDMLPQGLFVRGFVREYARFLALDEQKILTEFSFQIEQTSAPESTWVEPDPWISSRLLGGLVNGGVGAFVLGIVVVLIVSPGFSQKAPVADLIPAVDAPSSADGTPGGAGPHAGLNGEAGGGGTLVNAASVLPQPLQLTLTATEDCWIGLDVGGDRVENRVLKKGESFSINAKQNASLAVGNAGGLLIAIDSGPPMPLGNRGEVKRNIRLSPEALEALSAGAEVFPPGPVG